MFLAPLLAAAVTAFQAYNVIPDAGGDVHAVTLAEGGDAFAAAVEGGRSLYAITLPNGWTRADLNMLRPLARFRSFSSLMKRTTGRPAGLLVRGAPESVSPEDDDRGLPSHMRRMGEALAQSAPSFILLDGVFGGLDEPQAVAAARELRAGIDFINPRINAGYAMTPSRRPVAYAIAAALAAKDCRPVLRLDNADCLETTVKNLPSLAWATMVKTAYPAEARPDCFDDADAFPYNLWGKSAAAMHLKTATALMCGCRGAVYWYVGVCGVDGFPVHGNYLKLLQDRAGFYRELAASLEDSEPTGVAIPVSRADLGLSGGNWGELMFGAYGIPFHAAYACPTNGVMALMSAESVKSFTDDELKRILSGRVLVDGDAAAALSVRGFAEWLGADVRLQDLPFNCEMDAQGGMVRFGHEPLTPFISILDTNAVETLTWLVRRNAITGKIEKIAPGSTLFANAAGGTVIVTAFHCKVPDWNVLNEARKAWVVSALERLKGGRLALVSGDDQDVLVLTRRRTDGKTVALVANLGFDPVPSPSLLFAEPPAQIECLQGDGSWRAYRPAPLACAEAVVLRY